MADEPKEPGWYVARMKSWPVYEGRAIVKVTRIDSHTLLAWQAADERSWPLEAWDWGPRVYPDTIGEAREELPT